MFSGVSFYRYGMSLLMWLGITMVICAGCGADLVYFGLGGITLLIIGYSQMPEDRKHEDIKVWTFNLGDSIIDHAIPAWVPVLILAVSVVGMFLYAGISHNTTSDMAIVPFDMTVPNWVTVWDNNTYAAHMARDFPYI
jgi:hypothetical protein